MGVRVLAAVAAMVVLSAAAPAVGGQIRPQVSAENSLGPLGQKDEVVLLAAVRSAGAQGFSLDEFGLGDVEMGLRSADRRNRARAEARLLVAALAYARAQHGGRLSPALFRRDWAIRPLPYDAKADFEAARGRGDLASWAANLAPPDPRYGRLVTAFGRYREIAARGGWPILKVKRPLKAASPAADVRALRERLAIEDTQLVPVTAEAAGAYDAALADAVSRAQARYGLNVDGVAGAGTLAALNVPVERRLAQMRANLERWRWTPRELPADRVELNIAAAWFDEYEDGAPVLRMRAVVGRPSDPTPSFQDHIHAILFYPPWTVPAKIAANELLPKERRSPGYLAREGFRRLPNGRLQQQPGPKNALGLVKFELDGPYAVYFHDTPARNLFAKEYRALSHGCMRLEQPYALAKRLLRNTPDWPEARVDAALKSGVTQRAVLSKRAMAYVVYWTAFVDDQGQVNFRPDVYGWDDDLTRLLGSRTDRSLVDQTSPS